MRKDLYSFDLSCHSPRFLTNCNNNSSYIILIINEMLTKDLAITLTGTISHAHSLEMMIKIHWYCSKRWEANPLTLNFPQ